MAVPKVRRVERPSVREHVLRRLCRVRDVLEALGRLDDPEMVPVWIRCYRLDRIEELQSGRDVLVQGIEVRDALSADDRELLDVQALYVLDADDRLSRV